MCWVAPETEEHRRGRQGWLSTWLLFHVQWQRVILSTGPGDTSSEGKENGFGHCYSPTLCTKADLGLPRELSGRRGDLKIRPGSSFFSKNELLPAPMTWES